MQKSFECGLNSEIVGHEVQGNGDDFSGAIAILGIVGLTVYHVAEVISILRKRRKMEKE
jgi:hypothetical protein